MFVVNGTGFRRALRASGMTKSDRWVMQVGKAQTRRAPALSARILALLACLLLATVARADDLNLQRLLEATPGSAVIVPALLAAGVGANVTDTKGTTPLRRAAAAGYAAIVGALLQQGANAGLQNSAGATAWSLARARPYADCWPACRQAETQ
jgi:ankyrin repeat protein